MTEKNKIESKWTSIEEQRKIGIYILTAVLAVSLGVASGRFEAAFGEEAWNNKPIAQLSVALFIEALLEIFIWLRVIHEEPRMWKLYAEKAVTDLDLGFYTIGFGLLLALLVYFSDNTLFYSALFIIFKIILIHGHKYRRKLVGKGIAKAREEMPESEKNKYEKPWQIIWDYYNQQNFFLYVDYIPLILGVSAFILSISAYFIVSSEQELLLIIAFVILITSFFVQEGPINQWRRKRDAALRASP